MEQVPPPSGEAPPPLPSSSNEKFGRRALARLLSFCLALFLLDGIVSFVDDIVIVLAHDHALSLIRGMISLATLVMAVGLYGLIGMTSAVPRRLLAIPLFSLAAILVSFPLAIFWHQQAEKIGLIISAAELMLSVALVGLSRRDNARQENARVDAVNLEYGDRQDACPTVQGKASRALVKEEQSSGALAGLAGGASWCLGWRMYLWFCR